VRKKNKLLNFLKENLYCRARCSPVHGVGVFAIKDIPSDTDPFLALEKEGHDNDYHFYSPEELSVLEKGVFELVDDYTRLTMCKGKYEISEGLPRWVQGGCVYLINHSDAPNLKYVAVTDDVITTKKINKDEELFLDYNDPAVKNYE
tara:strand:- start:2802 stop:3242 length:441 start_codon:yes stop_codon:yes gene_type:complete